MHRENIKKNRKNSIGVMGSRMILGSRMIMGVFMPGYNPFG